MIIRQLILGVVLLANAFAQNGLLSPRGLNTSDLRTSSAFAQKRVLDTSGFDRAYQLSLPKPVQDKNFYLLSLFQRDREVRKLLSQNEGLRNLTTERLLALKKAQSCKDVGCFDELIRFNGPIIEAVATTLNTLANQSAFRLLAKKHLRPSGIF